MAEGRRLKDEGMTLGGETLSGVVSFMGVNHFVQGISIKTLNIW